MDPTVTTLLEGPVGGLVRVAAVACAAAVVFWVLTGVRLIGGDEPKRTGILRRAVPGVLAVALLAVLAVNPTGALEAVHGCASSVADWIAG